MNKYFKIIISFLFLLAVLFGLSQRKQDPYVFKNPDVIQSSGTDELRGYYQKAQDLAGVTPQNTTATFLAVGDIMLSRNVAGTIKKANDPLLPFSNMANVLKSTTFNFANLESPISGSNYFSPTGSLVFNAPTAYTEGLKNYNFQILNLANNHAFDQGLEGLNYTRLFLDNLGIQHIGTGNTLAEAWQPQIVEANGIKIGFIGASYSSVNDSGKTKNNYVARIDDLENLKLKIKNLKTVSDFVVVTMHAGTEYTRTPNKTQTDFAHAAIDYGADIVIGAHPHWVQTIEKYQNKYIFYSLGNFIFDQEWSQDTKEGLTLKIQVSKNVVQALGLPAVTADDLQGTRTPAKLDSVELIPVIIENYSTPRPANVDEAKKILEKIDIQQTVLH